MDILGATTLSAFRDLVAWKTGVPAGEFRMYMGKTYLADPLMLEEAGVCDGAQLRMASRALKARASGRVAKLGAAARSTKHDVRVAKEDVVDAVIGVGHETQDMVQGVSNDLADIQGFLRGSDTPRGP